MASGLEDNSGSYDAVKAIADYLLQQTTIRPKIGIICGSGLGGLADQLEDPICCLEYFRIPNFPISTVPGHEGKLVFGTLAGKQVVCMKGRFHLYEGHSPQKVTMPVRVMKLLGVQVIIVTNAAGGLNQSFTTGDIMIINDQINMVGMVGLHPLRGLNEEKFGVRFPDMSSAYDRELRQLATESSKELGMEGYTRHGVYICLSGPSYETPTECRMIRSWGGDAVGMSTAHEVTVARHCGLRVLGISLITNVVITDPDSAPDQTTNHEEVLATGKRRAGDMQKLVKAVVSKITV